MKIVLFLLTLALVINCNAQTQTQEKNKTKTVYTIVLKSNIAPGNIDTTAIETLTEPLRALAAFYAAMGGTMCDGENCQLTTALGLGKQGSDKHKKLIQKYFPNDKVAKAVVEQDCYLRPSGASSFSNYQYLTIIDFGDKVKVEYNLISYNGGEGESTKGPDTYLFKDNTFVKVKRKLWRYLDN